MKKLQSLAECQFLHNDSMWSADNLCIVNTVTADFWHHHQPSPEQKPCAINYPAGEGTDSKNKYDEIQKLFWAQQSIP